MDGLSIREERDEEYSVSAKSVSRDIADLQAFLADHRELTGNAELRYSRQDRCYRLYMDEFLAGKELFALVEVMIGAKAFSRMELLSLVDKLERFAAPADRPRMKDLIRRELYHYTEVKHDCESVQEMLWKLINCISERKEIQAEKIKKLSPAAMGVLTACCAVAVGGVVAAPVTGGGSLGISVVALTPAVVATGLSIPVLILVAVVGLTLLSMLFKKYTKIKVSLYPPEVVCERKKHC